MNAFKKFCRGCDILRRLDFADDLDFFTWSQTIFHNSLQLAAITYYHFAVVYLGILWMDARWHSRGLGVAKKAIDDFGGDI